MTHEQYKRERNRLLIVLEDAKDRGDYHLEMDVKELLSQLEDKYYNDDQL